MVGWLSVLLVMLGVVLAAASLPVEKGYVEVEDRYPELKIISSTGVGSTIKVISAPEVLEQYREIRTHFKPTIWGTGWFFKLFTFPRVECESVISNCVWGSGRALVKDGAMVTVGFSYYLLGKFIGCRSVPVEVCPSCTGLKAKTGIMNSAPIRVALV